MDKLLSWFVALLRRDASFHRLDESESRRMYEQVKEKAKKGKEDK